jgi:hypothetical protein
MIDLSTARFTGHSFMQGLRRYPLILACMLVVLCFVVCNDAYGATKTERRARSLMQGIQPGTKRIDYAEVVRQRRLSEAMLGASKRQYLIDPRKAVQPNMLEVFSGADKCPPTTSFTPSPIVFPFPYTDSGTTESGADDYNVATGLITSTGGACPSPTCEATNGTENFPDRGYSYNGTGDGPDLAYRISFGAESNMKIHLHPVDGPPNEDDLALIVYGGACSNNLSDVIVLADNRFPDIGDNDEDITITKIPPGYYHIVVDAYSYANQLPKSQGPYELTVDCAVPGCAQPLPVRPRR